MMQPVVLEEVARRAIDGDRDALDDLMKVLQGDVYSLAMRKLWNREDAEDPTQEILVRVVTRLGALWPRQSRMVANSAGGAALAC